MIADLERTGGPSELSCDIAIVGAGAVGVLMAVELSRRGADVLLLEGGGTSLEAPSQAIYRGTAVGHPLGGLENGRFRLLGGTTNFWGGQLVPFDPIVFDPRPWIGSDGWPFGRTDLDPYYDRCSSLLGLPTDLDDEALWNRLRTVPPHLGEELEVFLSRWLREPALARVFRTDLAGAALPVLVHANVVSLVPHEGGGRIAGVQLKTLTGRSATVRAGRVVLACGTIEISRLLLQPLSNSVPAPWAEHPWLGKAFLDHLDCEAGSVRILDHERFHSAFDNFYVDGFKYSPRIKMAASEQRAKRSLGVAGHFYYRSDYREHLDNVRLFARTVLSGRLPNDIGRLPAHVAALWKVVGPLVVRYLRRGRAFNPSDAGVELILTTEQQPKAESRILLSDELDTLGAPKVAVDWTFDGSELETMALFAEETRAALLRLHLADVALDPRVLARDPAFLASVVDGYHQMGGSRIGASAAQGVVDANLKVHGSENLFVAGAAVFPSTGFGNPTFTAMALGLRLCEHLIKWRP